MGKSKRFNQLISRVRTIENNLLPSIRINGNYTKEEQDKIRGYRLLIHAEIEAYLEERAKDKVLKAHQSWQSRRQRSNIITSIMTYNEVIYSNISTDKDTAVRINRAIGHYISKLQKNHGIKEKNVLEILLPIGVELSQLDQTWLNDLNSFGTARGQVAHSSARTQQPIDPATEKSLVNSILLELQNVDEEISKLK